uniref:uncharacterized protein LOC120339842 isoform X2 n=1 Tax=Styela clava TaxID=7725 RepID=UPI001939B884|nr:uncharacterized protein LOC120339842 isoform X2 [Styela clava]
MMLVRLLFLFALCALALGNYYNQPKKCYVKEVSDKYYDDFHYGQKDTYGHGTNKPRGRYCRNSNIAHAKRGYCPNPKPNLGYYDKSCPDQPCSIAFSYATSRCHHKVKLSQKYYYKANECKFKYGKSCHNFGFNRHGSNSGGYEPSPVPHGYQSTHRSNNKYLGAFSKCYCYTSKCPHKFVACYEYKGHYYQDTVEVQVPCGCSCYKGSKSWR